MALALGLCAPMDTRTGPDPTISLGLRRWQLRQAMLSPRRQAVPLPWRKGVQVAVTLLQRKRYYCTGTIKNHPYPKEAHRRTHGGLEAGGPLRVRRHPRLPGTPVPPRKVPVSQPARRIQPLRLEFVSTPALQPVVRSHFDQTNAVI